MKILNLNPDTTIGATAWLVELEGHRLLLDAGTHPRLEGRSALPLCDLIGKEKLDAIAISHCHHDHVGSLPVALRHFPEAHVLMTELSYFLAERVLHNSVNVMKRQRDELGIKEYPLYSHDEVDELAPRIQFLHLRNIRWLDDDTFFESGHIDGDTDMYALMKVLLQEQRRRYQEGRADHRMPMRPDHGVKILSDFSLNTHPGYPLVGRLKGLSELTGMETALERQLREG